MKTFHYKKYHFIPSLFGIVLILFAVFASLYLTSQEQNLDSEAFRQDITAFTYCSDSGFVTIGVNYTNEEKGSDTSKTVDVFFTDQQTGATSTVTNVRPGVTKASQIITDQRILTESQITVDVERIDNSNRMSTAIVGYEGITCQAPASPIPTPTPTTSATPSPTPTNSPSPSPETTPTIVPSPTPKITPTSVPGIGGIESTPTSTPISTPSPTPTITPTPESSVSAIPSNQSNVVAEFDPSFGQSGFGTLTRSKVESEQNATESSTAVTQEKSFNWPVFFIVFPFILLILSAGTLYLYQLTLRKPLMISIAPNESPTSVNQ